jgi:hypothetical protein
VTRLIHTCRRHCLAVVVAACTLGAVASSSASVVVPLSLPQLAEAADRIATGVVVDVRTAQGPEGLERLVQVQVSSTWKGPADATLYVRLAGGRLGATETRVPGVPAVEVGDHVVWFLVTHPRGGFSVLGLHQGALAAVRAADGTLRVLAPSRIASPRGDVSRVPRRVAELEAEVRALAGTGAAQ